MREKAYEIVFGVLEKQGHSDSIFHRLLEEMSEMDVREKKFIKRLSYGTIERAVELDAYIRHFSTVPIRRLSAAVRTVLRMALYEINYMDTIPEAVSCHEAVELLKRIDGTKYAGFVNGVLRSLLREKETVKLRPWEQLALPKNLYQHFLETYGKKTTKKIATAFLSRQAEITIHIDKNKVSGKRYEECLKEKNIIYEPGKYVSDAYVVQRIEDVKSLPGYQEGWFFVQDESSMLPVLCADIKPGDTVVDVCAAPGGKSMHALISLSGKGILNYRDVSAKKIKKIQENMHRFGYENAEGKVFDGTKEDIEWKEKADVVLADVPCSGIGIIGKKPEIKYRALQEVDSLVPIQRKICEASLKMLRQGGIFLYSTCTISKKENEDNVEWLVKEFGLQKESLNPYLPECLHNKLTEQGMIQILPGIHESDGFFLARLRKV